MFNLKEKIKSKLSSIPETTIYKILLGIVVFLFFFFVVFTMKTQADILDNTKQLSAENKRLNEVVVQMRSEMLTPKEFNKELAKFSSSLDDINKEVEKVSGFVYAAIGVYNITPGGYWEGVPSSGSIPNGGNVGGGVVVPKNPNAPVVDQYNYLTNIQYLNLFEFIGKDKMPIGTVFFDASKKAPWSYEIFPKKYATNVIFAADGNNNKMAFAETSIEVKGKKFKLTNTEARYIEKEPESKFRLWNPRVMLGVGVGFSSAPKLALTTTVEGFVSSYGKTADRSDWRFVGVGVGMDTVSSKAILSVTPVTYNITNNKLFSNVNIGPSVAFDVKGNTYISASLKLSL